MNYIETMKQALEALEYLNEKTTVGTYQSTKAVSAISCLRAAIDAAEKQGPADSWSLGSDYFFYTAEKHNADLSMCDEGARGTIWFNRDDFLRFCKELHNPAPTQPDSEQAKDAARYRWLRNQHWSDAAFCVVADPKSAVVLGHYCPSHEQLDAAIDAAMKVGAGETAREPSRYDPTELRR